MGSETGCFSFHFSFLSWGKSGRMRLQCYLCSFQILKQSIDLMKSVVYVMPFKATLISYILFHNRQLQNGRKTNLWGGYDITNTTANTTTFTTVSTTTATITATTINTIIIYTTNKNSVILLFSKNYCYNIFAAKSNKMLQLYWVLTVRPSVHDTKALIHKLNCILLMGYKSIFREHGIINTAITWLRVCAVGRKQVSLFPQACQLLRLRELDFHGRCSHCSMTIQFHTSNIVAKLWACALLTWTLGRLVFRLTQKYMKSSEYLLQFKIRSSAGNTVLFYEATQPSAIFFLWDI